jgi:hypothetical protein
MMNCLGSKADASANAFHETTHCGSVDYFLLDDGVDEGWNKEKTR